MKPSIKITGCMVFLSVMVAIASAPAQNDKLIGVWKVTLVTFKGPNCLKIQMLTNLLQRGNPLLQVSQHMM